MDDLSLSEYARSPLQFDIYPVNGYKVWPYFSGYHYMSEKYYGHHAWIAVVNGDPVGFTSIMAQPNGNFKNGWRGHRTVVAPQFQGLGLGARMSDWTAHYVVTTLTDGQGKFFAKTVHPRLGEYRENSDKWKGTSKNRQKREASVNDNRGQSRLLRVSYSHEYIGHLLGE